MAPIIRNLQDKRNLSPCGLSCGSSRHDVAGRFGTEAHSYWAARLRRGIGLGRVLARDRSIGWHRRENRHTPAMRQVFPVARQRMDEGVMIKDFNVSEKGHGSYWPLGILRWVMILIFISFGIQKFTPQSADGIAVYISNSPFVSWLSVFGIRGEAYLLGITELTTAALLVAGAFVPILSALGSLMGIGTFAITWSFFFSTPGVVKWSISTDPIAWNLTGEFLFKDIVLLCVCIVLFLASLPKNIVSLRSN
jgi:uncharacterized membrane protein YkgB